MNKNDSRRKLLKSIAVGSGAVAAGSAIPKKWSKPLVDSVVLPAHAQTTGCPSCSGPEQSEPYNSSLDMELVDGNLGTGTLKLIFGDGDTMEVPVSNGTFGLEDEGDCGAFLKLGGELLSQGLGFEGSFEFYDGLDSDGDISWGAGKFDGKGNLDDGWSGSASGTNYTCKS